MSEEVQDADSVDVEAVEKAADNLRPDFLVDKYQTVEDQAKAYAELNTEFGKKATEIGGLKKFQEEANKVYGAPEEYETPTFEEFEVDIADPRFGAFREFAKENNLSQDIFKNGLELFHSLDSAQSQANEEFAKEELAKLDNADTRLKNIQDWTSANLPDHADALADIITTADGVKAIEALLEKAGKSPVAPSDAIPANIPSLEEIKAMQFATDDNGERKMRNPQYAAKVQKLMEARLGKGDYQQFVG